MKCKKCGAILLDTDTFCGECGTRVVIDKCPNCGETIREGKKFCSKCGYQVVSSVNEENNIPEDDDIPVTGQMSTVDIPFDLIEKNILIEGARQAQINSTYTEEEYKSNDEYYNDDSEEYQDDEYEDEYYEDDYYEDEYYPEEYEDEEEIIEEKSLGSRLFTAGIIVIGLVIVLIIAAFFFNSRGNKNNSQSEIVEETPIEVNEDNDGSIDENIPQTIGTITIEKDANIRDNPSKENSTVILTSSKGTVYEYYGYAEGSTSWLHIKIDDNTDGYVYKDLVVINE